MRFAPACAKMTLVEYDWPHLAAAIRQRRDELGMTQQQVAEDAEVSTMTVRNLEAGRAYTRLPPSLSSVERALGWQHGSARAILAGGEPTLIQEAAEPTATDEPATPGAGAAAPLGDIRTLPLAVRMGLADGETLDYERIDWDVQGTGMHLYIIVKAGEIRTEQEFAAVKRQMEEWARIKKAVRAVIEAAPDEASDTSGN